MPELELLDDCVSHLHASLLAPENAAEICASLLSDARRRLEEDGGSFAHFDNPQDYTNLLLSLACMLCAALAAGLTMGVVSLEEVDLRVKLRCGSPEEQRCAGILLPLITHRPSHQLLVTLLVLNSLANEAMPIFLDALVPSTIAVLISVTAVLFVGEIIPAALFTGPSKLRIAAAMAPVVKLCMVVLSPVAYPLAIGLDWLLPHRASLQSRSEVQAMVEVQRDMAHESHDHDLADAVNEDEMSMLRGALSLGKKLVVDVMTPITGVYMLESTAVLDAPTMRQVLKSGYSRVPIKRDRAAEKAAELQRQKEEEAAAAAPSTAPPRMRKFQSTTGAGLLDYLIVKEHLMCRPEDATPVLNLRRHLAVWVGPEDNLFQLLNEFQTGSCHMAFVSRNVELSRKAAQLGEVPTGSAAAIGIITLEDIIEEILCEEIADEADREKALETVRRHVVEKILPALEFRRKIAASIAARRATTDVPKKRASLSAPSPARSKSGAGAFSERRRAATSKDLDTAAASGGLQTPLLENEPSM